MEVTCPSCGTPGQVAGKYCENCGYSIPVDMGQAGSDSTLAAPSAPAATQGVTLTGNVSLAGGGSGDEAASAQVVGAQFAVVRDGQANLNQGFTITRPGEFLAGRMDQETGHQVDVDLRQWVQPIDVGGQKQYLVHRKQCYLGLADDGAVFIKLCPGAEADTLVKGPGEGTFTSMQNLGERRTPRPDGSFELQLHDQIFMGDPDAVMYYISGNPTAQDNYLVIELINKS